MSSSRQDLLRISILPVQTLGITNASHERSLRVTRDFCCKGYIVLAGKWRCFSCLLKDLYAYLREDIGSNGVRLALYPENGHSKHNAASFYSKRIEAKQGDISIKDIGCRGLRSTI